VGDPFYPLIQYTTARYGAAPQFPPFLAIPSGTWTEPQLGPSFLLVIPEPATVPCAVIMLAAVAARRRRRSRRG
jgi:hypothetical protein